MRYIPPATPHQIADDRGIDHSFPDMYPGGLAPNARCQKRCSSVRSPSDTTHPKRPRGPEQNRTQHRSRAVLGAGESTSIPVNSCLSPCCRRNVSCAWNSALAANTREPKSGLLRFEFVRLCQATHVTSSTITGYLAVDELTGETSLLQQAVDRFPVVNLLDLGMATAMACWIIESLREEPNRLFEVQRIADEANIPSTLAEDYETARKTKPKPKR